MSPWKHLSVHALEQAYIRLGIDCYELLTYLSTAQIERVSRDWATHNFNVIVQKKGHEYFCFKRPGTAEDVLAIVDDGVVVTLLTKDLPGLRLKNVLKRGKKTVTRTMDGGCYVHKGF